MAQRRYGVRMNFPPNHPWVAPLVPDGGVLPPPGMDELASQAGVAASFLGVDAANARAYEMAQNSLTSGDFAQAEFYQRLAGEGMMLMQQQQIAALHAQQRSAPVPSPSGSAPPGAILLLLFS
jgi:hypothetical protein